MLRRWAALAALLAGIGAAHAQTAPGHLGLVAATPNVVQVLDSTKTWSTIGTIDTTSHVFTPVGGGGGGGGITDAPNDGTLYGRKSLAWSHITHNDITDWAASVPPAYTLPVASTTVLGGVKVDGTTITATGGGVISATATPTAPGGTTGQIEYNNAGAFGGFTASGDATINTATGAVAVTKTGGTAFGALATLTPGAGVATALGSGVNTNGGFATATTTSVVVGALNTGGGSGVAPVGLADVATGSYLKSGGVTTIPAWQAFGTGAQTAVNTAINTTGGLVTQSGTLAANALLLGGGSATAITSTTTGTGVVTALGVNVGTAGSMVVNGGALGTPSSGTLTNATGLPISSGVSGLGTGVATALAANLNAAAGVAAAAAPLTAGGSGSLSGAFGYYVCTGVCTVTLPTPAAGFQFCVRNDSTVVTVITIAAITSVQFEKTTYNGYGTVTTGTMVSGGALGDKICLIGRDATHYLVGAFIGTWTNS